MRKEIVEAQGDYRRSHSSDGYGRFYGRTYQSGYYYYQWELIEKPLLREVLERLARRGAKSCLDFACGTGRITAIADEYFDVVGVDVSSDMLQEAKLVTKSPLLLQDITLKPLAGQFDLCTAFRFFLNAEEQLRSQALEAIHAHLSEEGALVANIHVNANSILGLAYRLRNRAKGRAIANVESLKSFSELLERHGFSIDEVLWYSYLPRVGRRFPKIPNYAMGPFERMCSALPMFMRGWAQSFLVIARKL